MTRRKETKRTTKTGQLNTTQKANIEQHEPH